MNQTTIQYKCPVCNWSPSANELVHDWEHCPNCLSSVHEEPEENIACGAQQKWKRTLFWCPFLLYALMKLTVIQFRIKSFFCQKLFVGSLFDDCSLLHNQDQIRIANGG